MSFPNPERLDLCDRHGKLARDRGMKIVISTDAHRPEHFAYMRYGVMTARRGVVRLQAQGLVLFGNRPVQAMLVTECIAQVAVRLGEVRLQT